MKVLHLTSGNLFGGIETMLVSIARHAGVEPGLETQFAVCFDGRFRSELRHPALWFTAWELFAPVILLA